MTTSIPQVARAAPTHATKTSRIDHEDLFPMSKCEAAESEPRSSGTGKVGCDTGIFKLDNLSR